MENTDNINILVVDDDSFILSLAVRVLHQQGYDKVDTASNGKEAIEKLASSELPFDIVICDLNMPEMNGVDFMRHAKEMDYTGGIILLSGEDHRILDMAIEMGKAQNLNVLGSIFKPVSPPALEELLANYTPPTPVPASGETQQAIGDYDLEDALGGECNELVLYYQPIVHIRTGDISGVETVLKWQHPSQGLLEPEVFMPVAEKLGLSDELTVKAYCKAVEQTANWIADQIYLQNSIGVSLSAFSDDNLANQILNRPEELGISQKLLSLGFSEKQIIDNSESISEILMRLRFKNIGVIINDFSMSDSLMELIRSSPFSQLKISKDIALSAGSGPALQETNSLAKKLGMEVTINGVTNRAEWDQAEKLGFDYVQGEFCSRPLANNDLQERIESWSPPSRRA